MTVLSGPKDGYGFEREVGGQAFIDVDRRYRLGRIQSFWSEIRTVKGFQADFGWDPRRPKTPLSQCLFCQVARGLNVRGGDLGLYVAIGTRFDLSGRDLFFEYGDCVVTIDITVSHDKRNPRANFVLSRDHFIKDEHYDIARAIARRLSRQRR